MVSWGRSSRNGGDFGWRWPDNDGESVNDILALDLNFPREYLKAALVASFFSVCVLVGIFFYLNRYTKRRYFSFWTVAWLFHAFWLALCIALQNKQENPQLIMLKQWCVGASAVFLLSAAPGFSTNESDRRNWRSFWPFCS